MCLQGRIRELEEIRAELAEKELVLLGKEQELLERDQSVQVLREEASLPTHQLSTGVCLRRFTKPDSRSTYRPDLHLVESHVLLQCAVTPQNVCFVLRTVCARSWIWSGSCARC